MRIRSIGFGLLAAALGGVIVLPNAERGASTASISQQPMDLTKGLPNGWTWLGLRRVSFPPADPDCACPPIAPMDLPCIWTGRDTLVWDTVHTILWEGGCYEPCYHRHAELRSSGFLQEIMAANAKSRTEWEAAHHVHKVLPLAFMRHYGDREVWYFNGINHVEGRSGIYCAGTADARPWNLYGRMLTRETVQELRGLFEGGTGE